MSQPDSWRLMIATSKGATGPVITADIRPDDIPAIFNVIMKRMRDFERDNPHVSDAAV